MQNPLILLTLCIMASCSTSKQIQVSKNAVLIEDEQTQLLKNAVLVEEWKISVSIIHYGNYYGYYHFYDNGQFTYTTTAIHTDKMNKRAEYIGHYHYQEETDRMFLSFMKDGETEKECIPLAEKKEELGIYKDWEISTDGNYYPIGNGNYIWKTDWPTFISRKKFNKK